MPREAEVPFRVRANGNCIKGSLNLIFLHNDLFIVLTLCFSCVGCVFLYSIGFFFVYFSCVVFALYIGIAIQVGVVACIGIVLLVCYCCYFLLCSYWFPCVLLMFFMSWCHCIPCMLQLLFLRWCHDYFSHISAQLSSH